MYLNASQKFKFKVDIHYLKLKAYFKFENKPSRIPELSLKFGTFILCNNVLLVVYLFDRKPELLITPTRHQEGKEDWKKEDCPFSIPQQMWVVEAVVIDKLCPSL
ncbi:hypothetical protein OUZ56_026303 [Daphnia magna]|uniref:Uncharacterized protein n=1 Tax=Daphnia magna TaxID=35525 RepID=A0ABQ9ZM52_9CRUS|nr:hypothetical protein OUZ56_026303 [Daphnia magna]